MNSTKIISILIIGISLATCTKEIALNDLVVEQNKIVINSIINNTQALSVTVTKGFQYEKGKTREELIQAATLTGAQVAIYENDKYIEDLIYKKTPEMDVGEFSTSFIPTIGATYRIEATAEDLLAVQATAVVPQGVDIADATVKYGGGNSYPFSFTLQDPPEKNYYYLKMYFNGYLLDSLTQTKIDKGPFVVEIPEGALPEAQRYLDNGYLFKDDALAGKAITISGIAKLGLPIFSNTSIREERDELKKILLDTSQLFIYLETLSEDAYRFHNSNAKPLQQNIDFLNESTTVYGNVKNGFGLFAGAYISEVGTPVEQ